jgi:aminomethyltransferase
VADFAGLDVIISATGYTGSGGFEIYCKNADVEQIWNKVLKLELLRNKTNRFGGT